MTTKPPPVTREEVLERMRGFYQPASLAEIDDATREAWVSRGWDLNDLLARINRFRELRREDWLQDVTEYEALHAPKISPAEVTNYFAVREHYDPHEHVWEAPYVYIGRHSGRYNLAASIWANPYKIEIDTPQHRAEVLAWYKDYLLKQPELLARLEELRGKILVCWCRPSKPCHGDVLVDMLKALK